MQKDLINWIKNLLKTCRLRPEIQCDTDLTKYTNEPGHFIFLHMYWDEGYFDNLQSTDKYKQLLDLIRTTPPPAGFTLPGGNIGASDGHLYISFNHD